MCQLANCFKIAARILFNCNCFFSFLILEKEIEKAVDDKKRILNESRELQEAFEKLSTEYSETKKIFDQHECDRKRKENSATSFEMITDYNSSTRYRRRKLTEHALKNIHGSHDGAIFGAWDFIASNVSQALLDKFISSYKRGKYIQGVFGKAIKEYSLSNDALKKAVATKYQNFSSGRRYNFVCKTQNSVFDPNQEIWVPRNIKCLGVNLRAPSMVSQDRVDQFIKSLDIGHVSPIPFSPGVSRTVTGLVFMIIDLHLRVPHLRNKLTWFIEHKFHFVFQFSDDGAPETSELTMSIGSLTCWNFGEKIRSREYHYLLHCLSVQEKAEVMEVIWKQHTDEMEVIEGNIFKVAGLNCTIEFQPSADQSWQSCANNETTQLATYPSPFANVCKGNMNVTNGSIGTSESDTWKPYTMEVREEHIKKLNNFITMLKANASEQTRHRKKLEFMAENGIRQLGPPQIGKYADLQRPEPVHSEINSWGHLVSIIYREALRHSKIKEFLMIMESPVSDWGLTESTRAHTSLHGAMLNSSKSEGVGERSRQCENVADATAKFLEALAPEKLHKQAPSQGQPGCGLAFVANLIKEHYNDESMHHKTLSIRLIGEQAIQLARYSYRLVDSLKSEAESEQEELKRLALSKICQLLRDATALFNKVNVTESEVNIFTLFVPEGVNITVWTVGYAIPYHADLLYSQYKVGYGIISLQAKESKHAAVKYDLMLTNRSRERSGNGKWNQVMRTNYVCAFFLPEHHPMPSTYVSHFKSRIAPNMDNVDVCSCSRSKGNSQEYCDVCVLAEAKLTDSVTRGNLSEEVLHILKPVVCLYCQERFADISTMEVHVKQIHQSVKAIEETRKIKDKLHVRSMNVPAIKAELKKRNLALSGSKEILIKRLEGALATENN